MKQVWFGGLSVLWSAVAAIQLFGADHNEPKHLLDAQTLVKHLAIENTSYEHGKPDVHFAGSYKSHSDCSGFIDALLHHSYGFTPEQFKTWFGRERPTADRYHDAVVKQEVFEQILDFRRIHPGDILAVKYLHPKEKSTGHIMLVSGSPRAMQAREPLKPGTEQWEVAIIDSAKSGHGKSDTRHGKGTNGKDHNGLGEGLLRVYTDNRGAVVGYTWSISGKNFLSQQEEHMVIGRLKK